MTCKKLRDSDREEAPGSRGTSVLQISGHDGQSVFAIAMEVVAPIRQKPTEEATVELKLTDAGYQIHAIWLAGRGIGYEFSNK